jgi:MFS family permease
VGNDDDIRRYTAAFAVSSFGDNITLLALPLAAYARTGSALLTGAVVAMEALALAGSGLVVGALADRWPRRRTMVSADVAMAVVMALLAVACIDDGYPVAVLFGGALALGVLRTAHDAAATGVVPTLCPPERRMKAQSRIDALQFVATATGPALAGVLLAAGGPAGAFAIDALTFAVAAGLVAGLRALDRVAAASIEAVPRLRREIREGLEALRSDRAMLATLGLIAAANAMVVAVESQWVPFATAELGASSVITGGFFAVGGIVAVIAAMIAGRARDARGLAVLMPIAVMAGALLGCGLIPSYGSAAVLFVVVGTASAFAGTNYVVLRQARYPTAVLGRVTTTSRILLMVAGPGASIAGGALVDATRPSILYIALGVLGIVAVTITAPAVASLDTSSLTKTAF